MPRKSADYPEWVTKHKAPGTYINRVGDKYYLYAAHSERIKGTNKVRRVSDGYIGRITEKDGLIPAGSGLRSAPLCFEVGLSYPVMLLTDDIYKGMRRSYKAAADILYSCAILDFIYSHHDRFLFDHSYLSLRFKEAAYPDSFTKAQLTGIDRGSRMIEDTIKKKLDADYDSFIHLFSDVRLIKVKNDLFLTQMNPVVILLSDKYKIRWEDPLWQK